MDRVVITTRTKRIRHLIAPDAVAISFGGTFGPVARGAYQQEVLIVFVGNDAEVYPLYDMGLSLGFPPPAVSGEAVVTELYSSAELKNLRAIDLFGARTSVNASFTYKGLSFGKGQSWSDYRAGSHNNFQKGEVFGRSYSIGVDAVPAKIGFAFDRGVSTQHRDSLMIKLYKDIQEHIDMLKR